MKGAALLLAAFVIAAQQQTFRSEADAVRVDALVTDGGRPIAGLTAADFVVTDNGLPQKIDAIAIEDVPLSMMLALDASDSMRGRPFEDLKEAASAAIALLLPVDRVAVLTFSEQLRWIAPWSGARDRAGAAVKTLRAGGGTSLADAAYAALTLRDEQPGRRSLALIFSDGTDTASWLPESIVAEKAGRFDGVVFAVVLGNEGNNSLMHRSGIQLLREEWSSLAGRQLLLELADTTGGEVYREATAARLKETFTRIVKEFRTRYLLTYTPSDKSAGWHGIEVKLKSGNGRIRARRGYSR